MKASTPPLTEDEVATRYSVTVGTIRKWRYQKSGPAYIKIGGAKGPVRYRHEDLDAFDEKSLVQPKPKE